MNKLIKTNKFINKLENEIEHKFSILGYKHNFTSTLSGPLASLCEPLGGETDRKAPGKQLQASGDGWEPSASRRKPCRGSPCLESSLARSVLECLNAKIRPNSLPLRSSKRCQVNVTYSRIE